jgi:hypothetical protein
MESTDISGIKHLDMLDPEPEIAPRDTPLLERLGIG